jgi:transcriptional regulator with XRE-family HTH domain
VSKFGNVLQRLMGKRSRDPIDAEVAKRVRALRLQRGLSQTELSDALGVTFQQVQKYERGANRISAGRLFRIAKVLDVPVAFFFADVDGRGNEAQAHSAAVDFDFLQTSGAMRLIRAYSRIEDRGIRLTLMRLAESLAGE